MICAPPDLLELPHYHPQNIVPLGYRLNVLWNAWPMDRIQNQWPDLRVTVLNRRPYINGQPADWANISHSIKLQATLAIQNVGNTPKSHVAELHDLMVCLGGHNGWHRQWRPRHGSHRLDVFRRTPHRQSRGHLHHQWWLRLNRVNQHVLHGLGQSVPESFRLLEWLLQEIHMADQTLKWFAG